jgi:hypothetical protein
MSKKKKQNLKRRIYSKGIYEDSNIQRICLKKEKLKENEATPNTIMTKIHIRVTLGIIFSSV